jgi:hypothetical protein
MINILGSYGDQKEMRTRLWDIKSQGMTDQEMNLKNEIFTIERNTPERKRNRQTTEEMVMNLISEGHENLDDLLKKLSDQDIDIIELENILESLSVQNKIYSPRINKFRIVENQ